MCVVGNMVNVVEISIVATKEHVFIREVISSFIYLFELLSCVIASNRLLK